MYGDAEEILIENATLCSGGSKGLEAGLTRETKYRESYADQPGTFMPIKRSTEVGEILMGEMQPLNEQSSYVAANTKAVIEINVNRLEVCQVENNNRTTSNSPLS